MGDTAQGRLAVDGDLVGYRFGPLGFEWEPRDLVLYALSVGADPSRDLDFIDASRGPRALPLFPLIAMARHNQGSDAWSAVAVDPEQMFLANSSTEVHALADSTGTASYSGEVLAVWDKGVSALLVAELTVNIGDSRAITYLNSIMVQGAGGFGGDRGPSRQPPVEFTPELEVGIDLPANSAAIYQLVGDHNPHSLDPEFAAGLGLPGPISAGQVVMGAAALALTTHFTKGDHSALREISVDYAGSHFVGAPLTLCARKHSATIDFTVHSEGQPVLGNGRAVLG